MLSFKKSSTGVLKPKHLNSRGAALLVVLFTTLLLTAIAMQLASETIAEYQVSARDLKRTQAYYAAEACMQVSLLRVKLYQQASLALEGKIADPNFINFLWQFPLPWPLPLPENLSGVDRGMIQRSMAESNFEGQYIGFITPEDNKIDITDLVSPSEVIATTTRQQILEIFASKMEMDESFASRYRSFNFEELVDNITDWMAEEDVSPRGGNSGAMYRDFNSQDIPPRQPIKTMEELHMVYGMTDEIYDLLQDRITIYGIKGLNINQASKDLLMSFDPQITEVIATEILERRDDPLLGGPFVDEDDFLGFLGSRGVNTDTFLDTKIPLVFDSISNFRLECVGQVQDVQRKIIAIVYDFDRVKGRLTEFLRAEQGSGNESPDELARREACKDLRGDEKSDCLCGHLPSGSERESCVAREKSRAAPAGDSPRTIKPGPPEIILWKEDM